MGRRKKNNRSHRKHTKFSVAHLFGLILFALSIFSLVTFFVPVSGFSEGWQRILSKSFGFFSILIPFVLFVGALVILIPNKFRASSPLFLIYLIVLVLTLSSLLHLVIPVEYAHTKALLGEGGGLVGYSIELNLRSALSTAGAFLLLVSILIGDLILLLNVPKETLAAGVGKVYEIVRERFFTKKDDANVLVVASGDNSDVEIINGNDEDVTDLEPVQSEPRFEVIKPQFSAEGKNRKPVKKDASQIETITNIPYAEKVWEYPPISLLSDGSKIKLDRSHLNQNAKIIEHTLESFGVQAKVVHVNLGPAVTQYALELSHGTRLNRIINLHNDLARSLASPSGTVRIEAPIPGTSLVGVEVPNTGLKVVSLKSILATETMERQKSVLTVALGEDVSGSPVVADISKMPHMLVAGTTGSGKSVLINAMLATLLYRCSPWQLKLILVDPKRVELTQYRGIPHLLTDVIVEPDKVVSALKWAISEMTKRFALFEKAGVRNITAYNEATGFQSLPYIVIMIDELADLMMSAPREVESSICRLAQLSRATGIHLIIATQRPSVDIITGLIKANIPCRVAFNVSSAIDSRVILDQPGAERLLGRGDMLFVPPDTAKPTRIQGVYVDDREIKSLIQFLKSSGVQPEYKTEILEYVGSTGKDTGDSEIGDDLLKEALAVVLEHNYASVSLLQRRLKIGYNKAANLMEELEIRGAVSGAEGARRRTVKIDNLSQLKGFSDETQSRRGVEEKTRGEVPEL